MLAQATSPTAPKEPLRINKPFFFVTVMMAICFGSFIIGYEMVAITMLEREISNVNGISGPKLQQALTLVTAMMPLGAILGCLLARKIQILGENRSMMLSDIFVVASCLLMIRNLSVSNLCISRLLVGISCGISSSVIPPFLMSLAPPEWRTLVGSMHQILVTAGVGFSFYLGQRLPQLALLGVTNWQSYLFLPVLYACTRIIALLFFSFNNLESHYESGDTLKLRQFMRLFYNRVDIRQFVADRKFTKEKAKEEEGKQGGFLGHTGLEGKLLTVVIILLALNQLSGINTVLSYSKQLFMRLFYNDQDRTNFHLQVLAVVQILATMGGGWLANSFGRRRVLLAGGYAASAALFLIFLTYSFSPKSSRLLVGEIVLFVIAYASSIGVIPLLYLCELFPNLSAVNMIYWGMSLIGMLSSQIMLGQLGISKTFFLYGAVAFLCTFVLATEMIESEHKTSKELRSQYLYQNTGQGSALQYVSMKTSDPNLEDSNSLIELDQ